MSNINSFFFDLTYAPGASDRFQFFDVRVLNHASMAGNAQALLNAICSDPQLIDYSRPLTEDQCLWTILAMQTMYEDVQERVIEKELPFQTAFAQVKSRFEGWPQLHDKLSRSKPTSMASLRSIMQNFPITCPEVTKARVRDFKSEVLFRFPENMQAKRFDLMRRRVVDNVGQGSVLAQLFETNSNKDRLLIIETPRTATLKGALSPTLIGLNFTSDGKTGDPAGISGPTLKALVESQNVAAVSDLGLEKSVLKPTSQAKFDQLAALGQSAAQKIIESGSLGAESAAELKASLDASIDTLLHDATSPYSNKGYTRDEMIAIATEGLFGVEGVSQMRQDIAQGLKASMDQVESAQAALNILRSPLSKGFTVDDDGTIFFDDPSEEEEARITEAVSALDTAVKNYNNLLDYGSILYDIKAPVLSDSSARGNPGPLAVAGYVALTVMVAAPIIYAILKEIADHKDRECSKYDSAAAEINRRLANSLIDTVNTVTTMGVLDLVEDHLSVNQKNLQAPKGKLEELGCATGLVQGLNCLSSAIESWPNLTTFQEKVEATKFVAKCLDENAKFIDKVVADTEKRIAKRNETNIFEQWNAFLSKIPKIGSSILTYAAYTALGLGVIWGAGKVYRALKSSDEG